MSWKDTVSYILIIYSVSAFLFLIFYFEFNSPEYVTHSQLTAVLGIQTTAIFSAFITLWIKLSNFTKDLGKLEGRIDGLGIRMDRLEHRMDKLDDKMGIMENRMTKMDSRLENIEKSLAFLTQHLVPGVKI